ncbi:MAG: nucleoside triphosphate pyrophosphohydrolase [bacterium]|nr:nucleoside triphosphate pyrophosphohydrolase [bacterium]MDO8742719.1 nucleoside triphosphate pyrophosphohydrolase [bacterium]
MIHYEKLVRDKIPEILDKKSVSYEKRIASPEEYRTALIKKLEEEVDEFSKEGNPEELADIMEVIGALKKLPEYQDVEKIRLEKLRERGGFSEKIILRGEK